MEIRFLGGHPALDFVNTVGGRTHSSEKRYTIDRERIESLEDFYEWAAAAGLTSRRHPAKAARPALVRRAHKLREALYRLFIGIGNAEDEATLNRELSIARSHERLAFSSRVAAFAWDDRNAPDSPLWMIARAAAELLTSQEMSRLRRCSGESCGWLFLDTSRNHSRQWCDMRDCGNSAKVKRYRARQKAE